MVPYPSPPPEVVNFCKEIERSSILSVPPTRESPSSESYSVDASSTFSGADCESILDLSNFLEEGVADVASLSNRIVVNKGKSRKINCTTTSFYIPGNTIAIQCDVRNRGLLMQARPVEGFDLILLDPPWENKSVARSHKYQTLRHEELLDLCVPALFGPKECLVLVWCTNRPLYQTFIREELFPAWGVAYVTTWYWIKVTASGRPIGDISGAHRRPYEPLFIGRFQSNPNQSQESFSRAHPVLSSIPAEPHVFASTPREHSRKPSLAGMLEKYLPKPARCLDLFARNLTQGWTSAGLEVFLFQQDSSS